jgi:hypothetical protein
MTQGGRFLLLFCFDHFLLPLPKPRHSLTLFVGPSSANPIPPISSRRQKTNDLPLPRPARLRRVRPAGRVSDRHSPFFFYEPKRDVKSTKSTRHQRVRTQSLRTNSIVLLLRFLRFLFFAFLRFQLSSLLRSAFLRFLILHENVSFSVPANSLFSCPVRSTLSDYSVYDRRQPPPPEPPLCLFCRRLGLFGRLNRLVTSPSSSLDPPPLPPGFF